MDRIDLSEPKRSPLSINGRPLLRNGKPLQAGEIRPGEVITVNVFTGEVETTGEIQPFSNRAARRAKRQRM